MAQSEIHMSKRVAFIAALLAFTAAASAQTPPRPIAATDFAWQWPVETGAADGVVRFTLTPEVYARVTRADLGDLAAFNAAGESIPIGPAALAFERLAPPPPPPAPIEVALFRVPREPESGAGDRIALHIARGADGKLSRLDAEVTPDAGADASQDVLIDVSALKLPVTALRLELEAIPAEGLNARVEVAASDDLAHWQTLGSNLAVVALQENGLSLERRQLEFTATELPYLRVRRSDANAPLPLRAILALPLRRAASTAVIIPARQAFALQGRALATTPGSFEYLTAGPYPVERIAIDLADRNAVAGFVLESRDSTSAAWQERTRGTAFRLGSDSDGVGSAPVDLAQTRDRHWRLRTEPPQARAPTLTLSYRPEQFVLLTQGAPPYRLVAGSVAARRPDYPLRTVLSEMRAQYGDLWLPPEASVGVGAPLSGDVALTAPPPPPPYKQWLLWGVLIAGALVVVVMVMKLMRTPPPE